MQCNIQAHVTAAYIHDTADWQCICSSKVHMKGLLNRKKRPQYSDDIHVITMPVIASGQSNQASRKEKDV